METLQQIAKHMVAEGKGILAADESHGTFAKRLASIGLPPSDELRQQYRELLLTTPSMEQYISGVILFDETIRQTTKDGLSLSQHLLNNNIYPGIKVDAGAKDLANFPGEKITEGLDTLRERLAEYKQLGAAFAKWRAVITIDLEKKLPTDFCVYANAHALARYAALCQEAGIVPIVEPEVLMDGNHSIDDCFAATKKTLDRVFEQLRAHGVQLDGMLLKPNMVLSGMNASVQATAAEVAQKTLECFQQSVPSEVPGIVFLSGGQSEQQACETLNEINIQKGDAPWQLSFSYGRALQASALKAWAGKSENMNVAQDAFLQQAKCTSQARTGTYSATV